jgi:hypothetical protein
MCNDKLDTINTRTNGNSEIGGNTQKEEKKHIY